MRQQRRIRGSKGLGLLLGAAALPSAASINHSFAEDEPILGYRVCHQRLWV